MCSLSSLAQRYDIYHAHNVLSALCFQQYTNQKSFSEVYNPYNDNEDGTNFTTYAENYIKNAFSEGEPSDVSFVSLAAHRH